MLKLEIGDLSPILRDYGLPAGVVGFTELQRYDYESKGPDTREVRLILRVETGDGRSLVLRLKNEPDAPQKLMEAQSRFAALLREKRIETPLAYRAGEDYTRRYDLKGYPVVAALEDFAPGELTLVDLPAAEETGALLARMHNAAEAEDAHVDGPVLFDPLGRNDLFRFSLFTDLGDFLRDTDAALYGEILRRHDLLRERIRVLEQAPRYAVQGDISDCNLYRTGDGRLGVFDFNNCGDNGLFADAVMQAVFEARLMDYPDDMEDRETRILEAFLRGYDRERPFTREERALYPGLYGLINAFWLSDLKWDEDSLEELVKAGDRETARARMEGILRKLTELPEMPV
ncbi:MAG: hypothetical protein IKX47_08870 [Oscillospiraceae bacterium]|nr:hypothetical protein [Oscillospiraceae bacterium]